MKIKKLTNDVLPDIWWIIKRDSWIIGMASILLGKYADLVPAQHLLNFLEQGSIQYLILFPFPILTIIILSHICTQGKKKLKPTSSRLWVQTLYAVGTITILIAHVVTFHVFAMTLFFKTLPVLYNPSLDFWKSVEMVYAAGFTPAFDWYIFRRVIPKAFSDEDKDMKETWYCHILHIPGKNMIASALVFFIIIVLLEIALSG